MILATYRLQDITPKTFDTRPLSLKTNHDFGRVLICRDRSPSTGRPPEPSLRIIWRLTTGTGIVNRSIAASSPACWSRKFLQPDSDDGLREFKIFCFHGRPHFIMVTRENNGVRTKPYRYACGRCRCADAARQRDPSSIAPPHRVQALLDTAENFRPPSLLPGRSLREFGRVRFWRNHSFQKVAWTFLNPRMGTALRGPSRTAVGRR